MRFGFVRLALALMPALGACTNCPPCADFSVPAKTLQSFQRAFDCDDERAEYACFSSAIKTRFGGFPAYSIGRTMLKDERSRAARLSRFVDIADRAQIDLSRDHRRARASIDVGDDAPLIVVLVDEPEYLLHHEDGEMTRGYARRVEYSPRPGGFDALVREPDFEVEHESPVIGVEIRPHWVIDELPGIEIALERAHAPASP